MNHPRIRFPDSNFELEKVDVALVMESTYPYLKGGVSAVVHDIITHNPDLRFGIIHIAWDSKAPTKDLYGVPENVAWIDVLYLSIEETKEAFTQACMGEATPRQVRQLVHAIKQTIAGNFEPMRALYHEAMNPQTRTWNVWATLTHKDLMVAAIEATGDAGDITLGELFWLVRDFFSLGYSLLHRFNPPAKVYHAHTTGYASLVAATAAIQNGGAFFLTEHNLYVRDTVNALLNREMSLPVTMQSPQELAQTTFEKFWTWWWVEMGAILYTEAEHITYLYPQAIDEAQDLAGDRAKSETLPNGIVWEDFDYARNRRREANEGIAEKKTWRFACIARVVPIKGIIELIDSVNYLKECGIDNIKVDVLGPTEHVPQYYQRCVEYIEQLGLEDRIVLRGTVNVRDVLHDYDALVLSSFNEGQPIVVLESMVIGLPVIGTDVGGMDQLVTDVLIDEEGNEIHPCGDLVKPGDSKGLAELMIMLTKSPETYIKWHENSLARIRTIFLMPQVMARYNAIYRRLGAGEYGRRFLSARTADLARGADDIHDYPARAWDRYPGQHKFRKSLGGGGYQRV
ncbi:MAG: GT4 family glycosyltransferase PelF [Corynebacterium sp.]|uniref:GT4 family glycosyltransferase PelF n=1 Tax=Corynebacterium sp. TaxID=1720 RepID=UPI0026DB0140|nr:GT4 family glycosyltransferase PelF [Corynebacterium sp.]MDO4761613.1 GT4 family glycosyltransferase PelF [Corynebacterium sp.]